MQPKQVELIKNREVSKQDRQAVDDKQVLQGEMHGLHELEGESG